MLTIHLVVQIAHRGGGELAGELVERRAQARMRRQSFGAHDYGCLIGRKVVPVVTQHGDVQHG